MCGICGVLDFEAGGLDAAWIHRMNETLRHRGPDDAGAYAAGPVMLGHRRLAIIDLSPTGRQPMASPDGSVVIVYNGETYNFPELREELAARGHRFRGTSDTEVVLHAYLEWGEESFVRLNDMFALAIWDARRRRLLLARDRFLDRPKQGFGVPYSEWLRGKLRGYMESVLLDPSLASSGLFDRTQLLQCIDEHVTEMRDNGFLLYKAPLHLALWYDAYLG